MPQSTWYASAMDTIDGSDPNGIYFGSFDLGFFYAGGLKSFRRRVIIGFELNLAPASGRTLAPTDVISSAVLTLRATVIVGPTGWGAKAARVSRADWDDATATWNNYKTGSAWTAAGGDVTTPPADVAFISPASLGDFNITGVDAHVSDAITNRAGLLLVRLKSDSEADAGGVSTYFSGGDLNTSIAPRLTVTYTSADPSPFDRPAAGSLGAEHASHPAQPSSPAVGAQPAASAPASRQSPRSKHDITPTDET